MAGDVASRRRRLLRDDGTPLFGRVIILTMVIIIVCLAIWFIPP